VYGATQVSLETTVSDENRVWKIDTVTAQVWEYVSGWSQRPEQRRQLGRMGLSRKARGLLFAARLLQRLNSQEIQGKWLLPPLPLSQA
jgi:hypothetical protein